MLIGGGQIQWISSLRGILVFLVFFSHLTVLPLHKDLLFIIGRIGVAGFFLFERYNVGIKAFDKLGELGFTFFLGADIPISIIRWIEPDIMNWNCYIFCSIKFVLAVVLSYVITQWCEKPLLAWGKGVEKSL